METVVKRIKDFNKGYDKDLVRLKYKLMSENAFRFFRGTCHLFYEDLVKSKELPPSPLAWICGDLHVENFGSFRGDNHLVYFDLNDFDEGLLAPLLWEIVRMVTSILIAFTSLKIEEKKALNMIQLFLKVYSETLAKGKARYIEPKIAEGIVCKFLNAAKARTQEQMLKKRTVKKKKKLILLIDNKRHLEIEKDLKEELIHQVPAWLKYNNELPDNYNVMDAIFRIAGTGSVGLKRYCLLLQNRNKLEDYLLLDMKQAMPSSLHPYINTSQPKWDSEGQRIITIQSRMQNVSPALLSATTFKRHSYTIQEMQPSEDKIDFSLIKDQYRDIYKVVNDMAILTASAQLRSSGHQGAAVADELIAFSKEKVWQNRIIDYAINYAHQTTTNYLFFRKARKENYFTESIV
jgi:uncharacterized protein (DUF2252 family)